MSSLKVLLLGGSGQVGGKSTTACFNCAYVHILPGALLGRITQTFPNIKLTVILRTKILDAVIRELGADITIVHADFNTDLSKIESISSSHDIIINAATSRDTDLAAAILRGTATHKSITNCNTILVHLSGAGNFSDNSIEGVFKQPEDPFNDTNPDHVRKINSTNKPNGACDELILREASLGQVNAYFVSPGGVYGSSRQHIAINADSAEARRYASARGVWVGWMFNNISERGFSPYVGPGTSVMPTVHVDDVVSLILSVMAKAIQVGQNYLKEDAYKHYYLAIAEAIEAKRMAQMFADAAYKLGIIAKAETRVVAYDEVGTSGGYVTSSQKGDVSLAAASRNRYLAGNIVVKAQNAAKLGWKPNGPHLQEVLEETMQL